MNRDSKVPWKEGTAAKSPTKTPLRHPSFKKSHPHLHQLPCQPHPKLENWGLLLVRWFTAWLTAFVSPIRLRVYEQGFQGSLEPRPKPHYAIQASKKATLTSINFPANHTQNGALKA
jgi:hypothetical protein